MDSKLLEIKAALTLFFTVVGTFLGWKGILALIWFCVMCLDYLTGSMAAKKNGEWDSSVARAGLWHKGGMIAVILVATITDAVLTIVALQMPVLNIAWPGLLLPLVLVWYIITELGSILENSIKMGAVVPEWLARGLKITAEALDKAGNDAVDNMPEGHQEE